MSPEEAQQLIVDDVSVTGQKVRLMKAALMRSSGNIDGALKELKIEAPKQVIINADVKSEHSLRAVSDFISFRLAGCEALWALVHAGVFLMASESVTAFEPSIGWTTVHGNSGGMSASWQFPQFRSSYPGRVSASHISDRNQSLRDADLFLERLAIPELHPEIELALRDAVRCFRAELFTPSVVMLGKASEGTWIEMGLGFAAYIGMEDQSAKKLAETMSGTDVGFARKLREIMAFFETRQSAFKPVASQAGTTLQELRLAMLWADVLRDARNAVHHGVQPVVEHTYETVTVLFLSAVPHLRTIYSLLNACKTLNIHRV